MPNDAPQSTAVAKASTMPATVVDNGEFGMLMDTNKFAQLQRIGIMYARSKMVPSHFQGDEPSCMVAVQMAMRLNIDPFMFLQKTYVVSGKPGMEAPLVIALINTRGPFVGPIDWDLKKDDKGDVVECTAFATHKATGRVCSSTVTWKMVEAEGWSKKSGSKWLTLREQMFKYRSAAFLGRLYCPEVLMGMATADELHDQEIDVTPPAAQPAARPTLKDRIVANAPIEAETVDNPPPKKAPSKPDTAEDLAKMGITIDEGATKPSQAGAGAAQGSLVPPTPQPADQRGPGLDFEGAMRYAKKAQTQDQADIVRDAMNSPDFTDEQKAEVLIILNSKKFKE